MKKLISLMILAFALTVTANPVATAYHTGRREVVKTVTHKYVLNCEYSYNTRKFWRLFDRSSCPYSIEVY